MMKRFINFYQLTHNKLNTQMSTNLNFNLEQKIHSFIHNNFGFKPFREALKIRKDAFFQLIPDEDSAADNELMRRLSSTIVKLGQLCSQECIEPRYNVFTREERDCIKECTRRYFEGYYQIVKWTNTEIGIRQ